MFQSTGTVPRLFGPMPVGGCTLRQLPTCLSLRRRADKAQRQDTSIKRKWAVVRRQKQVVVALTVREHLLQSFHHFHF